MRLWRRPERCLIDPHYAPGFRTISDSRVNNSRAPGCASSSLNSRGLPRLGGFFQRLRELGYVEGQNVVIEGRFYGDRIDRLPALAAELVRLPVDVIVAGIAPAPEAARGATSAIPIVMAIHPDPVGREYAEAGDLMAYGVDIRASFRRAADYVDRILKGAKPGDLPVEQPTKYQFVVNLKTAKMLGLAIPPSVLARADEVIQ